MSETLAVIGAGGGSKGGNSASGSSEVPNNLVSKAVARVIDLLGEGEIGGFVEGARSIFLDDTPLEDADGNLNFEGVSFSFLTGTPDQDSLPQHDALEGVVSVGVEVTHATPIVRTVTDLAADELLITMSFPSLLQVDADDGSISGYSVQYVIAIACGGDYVDVANVTVTGKTNSAYERQSRITDLAKYGAGPWDVRITRVTADSEDSNIQDTLYWESYSTVIKSKFRMPDVAAVGITIDAEQFGTKIPTRAYEIYGLNRIPVPSNYNPRYATYTGIWDGTFQHAWTNNPAWCLYDLLTNTRYGLGIAPQYIDKWSFYAAGQYCDELVPNGYGSQEQRFTFNALLQTQEEAYHLINAIASSMLCMPYWSSGMLTLVQDAPADPSHLATPANVVGGVFNYSGTALKSRHSVALVTWNDPVDGYKQAIEVVEFPELIEKYGWAPLDVLAVGCTRRSQAHRLGRWLIETEQGGEVVTFTGGFEFADCVPGAIVTVQDPAYAGVRFGGRIVEATTTSVTLDASVVLASGQVYTLSAVLPDGTVEERSVTSAVGTRTVLAVAAFTTAPQANAVWVLSASNVAPRLFRVLTNVETAPHQFEITAMWHDPTKYARVYDGLTLKTLPTSRLPSGKIAAPTSLVATTFTYEQGNNFSLGVVFSWKAIPDARVTYYEAEYRRDAGAWLRIGDTTTSSIECKPLVAGNYEFRVRGRGVGTSVYATVAATVAVPYAYAYPPNVKGFHVVAGTTYTTWQLDLAWNTVIGQNYFPRSRFRDYKIDLCLTDGTVKQTLYFTTESCTITQLSLKKYFGHYERHIVAKISARDITFTESANPYSLAITWLQLDMASYSPVVTGGYGGVQVDLASLPFDPDDVMHYRIYADTSNPPTSLVATVPPTETTIFIRLQITAITTIYVRVVPVDYAGDGTPSAVVSAVCNPSDILPVINAVWASAGTYPRIEISETAICGLSAATVREFYLDAATGKAFAGGGDVTLDKDGVSLKMGTTSGLQGGSGFTTLPNVVSWRNGSNAVVSSITAYTHGTSGAHNFLMGVAGEVAGVQNAYTLSCANPSLTGHARLSLASSAATNTYPGLHATLTLDADAEASGTENARIVRATGDKFVFTLPTAVDVFKVISDGAHVLSGNLFVEAGKVGIGVTPSGPLDVYSLQTDPVSLQYSATIREAYACTTTAARYTSALYVARAAFAVPADVVSSGRQTGIHAQTYISDESFLGTISDLRAIHAQVGISVGTGTVTNAYGIYIENYASAGTITNNYGLFQATAAAKNYFAGSVGVGTNTPDQKLTIYETTTNPSASVFTERLTQDYTCTATRAADYCMGLYVGKFKFNVPDTVITSGYQIGLSSQCFVSDANFAGTITEMKAIWARVGCNVAASSGTRTITTAYGLHVETLSGAGTITNSYGIYQSGAGAKNYFAGPIINGGTAIGGATAGSGGVLGLQTTTLPTATTADYAWLAEQDAAGAAGKGALHLRSENMGSADWAIVAGFVYKTSAGDYANPHEGLGCINTADKNVKLYAGGAWRTLTTWT